MPTTLPPAPGDRILTRTDDDVPTYFRVGRHSDLSDAVDTRCVRPRGFVLGERARAVASER